MENIELSDGTIVTGKSLDFETFSKLKKESIYSEPITNIQKAFNVEAYQLKGKVVANDRGYCMLFDSLEDLEKVLQDFNPSGAEIMQHKNPYGKEFPDHAHVLIENLIRELHIEPTRVVDEKLLPKVDAKLNGMKSTEFKKKHFIHLIALVGEVLKSTGGIDWEMKLSSDGQTWNPYMKRDKKTFEFFVNLYQDIYIRNDIRNMLIDNFDLSTKIRGNG